MDLYRLELMKLKKSVWAWTIAGVCTGLFVLGILFLFIFQAEGIVEERQFSDWSGLLALTTAVAFACFCILAAAIAAKMIIGEYCDKNAVVLLSYPVERKAVLRTKCLLLCGITTVAASISNMVVIGLMYVTAYLFGIMPQMDTGHFAPAVLSSGILMGISASAVGVISAVIGWKKRSVTATIVCSLLIVCTITNLIAASPKYIVYIMLVMSACLAAVSGFLYRMLEKGIEKMEV